MSSCFCVWSKTESSELDCKKVLSAATVLHSPRSQAEILKSPNLKSFSFNVLRTSTRNFRPDSVLGEGGFGLVFKGWIDEHSLSAAKPGTGTVIAVKRLNQEGLQGHQEWLVSINYKNSPIFFTSLILDDWIKIKYSMEFCNNRQKSTIWGSYIIQILYN